MSFERIPPSDGHLQELASLSAEALANEDWSGLEPGNPKVYQFESVQRCAELQQAFERQYHLRPNMRAASSMDQPDFIDSILLHDPFIYIQGIMPDGGDMRLRMNGNVPIPYLGMILMETTDLEDNSFRGPHFLGIIDTDLLYEKDLQRLGIEAGEYTFLCPFKYIQVSESHIPRRFN